MSAEAKATVNLTPVGAALGVPIIVPPPPAAVLARTGRSLGVPLTSGAVLVTFGFLLLVMAELNRRRRQT